MRDNIISRPTHTQPQTQCLLQVTESLQEVPSISC